MEIVFDKVSVIKNKGTKLQKTIINDFNLIIKQNDITGVCGGPGKTTIGKLIPALENINNGTIKVGEFLITRSKAIKNINDLRFEVGYLFSEPSEFLYNSTVREEIEFGLKYYKYKLERIDNRVVDSIKMVGLDTNCLDKNPRELSTIEQKKVMLAAVLAFNPKVLIFDDFEKGLSKKEKSDLKKLLRMLKDRFNKVIIIITNDVSFMFDFCNRIIVLKDGMVYLDGGRDLYYDDRLYELVNMPVAVEFVKDMNNKGHKLEKYTDVKDVLKAVYRDVG